MPMCEATKTLLKEGCIEKGGVKLCKSTIVVGKFELYYDGVWYSRIDEIEYAVEIFLDMISWVKEK